MKPDPLCSIISKLNLLKNFRFHQQAHNNKFHADKKEKNKKYKKYVYDQISAQIEEAQRDDT